MEERVGPLEDRLAPEQLIRVPCSESRLPGKSRRVEVAVAGYSINSRRVVLQARAVPCQPLTIHCVLHVGGPEDRRP